MPQYLYQSPETEEYIEITQSVNDVHEYFDDKGVKWNRIFTVPNVAIDSKVNPWDSNAFVQATKNKKGTVGNIMDYSREMSERRGGAEADPIKKKSMDDWEKFRNKGGKRRMRHPDRVKNSK